MRTQVHPIVAKSCAAMSFRAASELRRGVGCGSVFKSQQQRETEYWTLMATGHKMAEAARVLH